MKPKKSWKEKLLDSKDLPKTKVIVGKQEKRSSHSFFIDHNQLTY
jgi:hypothetical protein